MSKILYNNLPQHEKERVCVEGKKRIQELVGTSNVQIAKILSEEFGCVISENWVRRKKKEIELTLASLGEKADEIQEQVKKAKPETQTKAKMAMDALITAHYEPQTDQYTAFDHNEGIIKPYIRSRKFLDKMMGLFSKIGKEGERTFTSDEVMKEMNISGHEWNCRYRTLHIRQNGPDKTPETIRRMQTEKDFEQDAEKWAEYTYINKTKRAREKQKQKISKKAISFYFNFRQQIQEVQEALREFEGVEFQPVQLEPFDPSDTYFLLAGDSHIGGRDLEETNKTLRLLAQNAIDRQEKNIVIFRKGDSFECAVAGGMHAGQTEEMAMSQNTDKPYFGVNLVIYSAEVIFEYLLKPIIDAGKQVRFVADAGNHGRGTKKQEQDMVGGYELMMYELIRAKTAKLHAQIEYSENLIKGVEIAGIHWINYHGHGQTGKTPNAQIVQKYGSKKGVPNYIVKGHFHEAKQQTESQVRRIENIDAGTGYVAITTPALCPANRYALEQVVADSPRGFVSVERTPMGLKNGFYLLD